MAATAGSAVGEHKHAVNGKKLPVTIITGFLGSGKTTLLSYILNNKTHGLKIAVINNEFAAALDIGTKHELDSKASDSATVAADIYETGSGCLCCSGGKSDFVRIMHELIHHKDKINYVLLETTGMADPSFSSVFFLEPAIKEHFVLDGFVTLVDARHAIEQLDRTDTSNAAAAAAEAAGDIEVTKSVPIDALTAERAKSGILPPGKDEIINETVTQLAIADRIIINKIDLVANNAVLESLEARIKKINPFATLIRSEYARIGDLKQILNLNSFSIEKVLKRDSGFLDFRPYRRHDPAVQPLCFIAPPPQSAIAAAKAATKAGAAPAPAAAAGGLELARFEKWIRAHLTEHVKDVLRFKAVLHINGKSEKYMVQGVKDMIDIEPRHQWEKDEMRVSRLVFIGRNLNEQAIVDSFNAAMNDAATPDADRVKLRVYGGGGDGDSFAVRVFIMLMIVLAVLYNWVN